MEEREEVNMIRRTICTNVESPTSMKKLEKRMNLNMPSPYLNVIDKLQLHKINLDLNLTNPRDNEGAMRTIGLETALSNITNNKYILLTSDADEIPKARFMHSLSSCQLPDPFIPLVLDCDFYYYSYEFRNTNKKLYGSSVTLIDLTQLKIIPSAATLRKERFNFRNVPSSCYHCTWCFNRLNQTHYKISSYSHTEHNQIQFRTREHILDHYRHGKDLFDRPAEKYIYVQNNMNISGLLKKQSERFICMTKQANLTNVGFVDA